MAIPDNKTRMIITLPDKFKSDFEFLCEIDKRTPSKQFEFILEYYLNNSERPINKDDYESYYNNVYLREKLSERIVFWFKNHYCNNTALSYEANFQHFCQSFKNEKVDNGIIEFVINNRRMSREFIPIFMQFVNEFNNINKD